MGFYWKGDQLVARRGRLDESTPESEWTTIEIPLRQHSTMPKPFEFLKFITTSLTFMKSLETVTVYVDNIRLAKISKQKLRPQSHPLSDKFSPSTGQGTTSMKVTKIDSTGDFQWCSSYTDELMKI
jgi:hypothetical protein